MVEGGQPLVPPSGGARAEERRVLLRFQVVMWSLLNLPALLPALGLARVSLGVMLRWMAAWTASGLLISTAVGVGLSRLPDRLLRGPRVVFLVFPLAVVASLGWTGVLVALQPMIGREPMLPPDMGPRQYLVASTGRGILLLGLWSALFLVDLLSTRVQRAREQSVRARAAADEAQLQLLKSQLNPHFLFNALNSVVGLIGESPRAAQGMVRDLAALLRQSLDTDGSRAVTVAQELDFVRLYLKCEQVRFEERLQVELDVAPGVERLWVPPMLLHPLVENAVKHGMRGLSGPALRVRISVRREGDRVVLLVANDGRLAAPGASPLAPGAGIGVRNVRERLAQLFPDQHAFELTERDGQVVASLEVPAREAR